MNPNNDDNTLSINTVFETNTLTTSPTSTVSSGQLNDSITSSRPSSRHYFYRKASLPSSTPPVNEDASTQAFENKLKAFIKRPLVQHTAQAVSETASVELARRKAERRARKEKERGTGMTKPETTNQEGPLFASLKDLSAVERTAWLTNINDEAMLLNPHQWLKLGSLFNVNSKVARQTSVLPRLDILPEVLEDRKIKVQDIKPLENYLELRDVQNRNYARDSVAEGIKLIKVNKVKEAMEHYKRALDMDPKYADGWFHVAEAFVQQKKLKEAGEQLEKVLKIEADHEGAKALLASVKHALDPKPLKKDDWDLVDEHGQNLTEKKGDGSSSRKRRSSPSQRRKRSSRSPSNRHRRDSRSPSRRKRRESTERRHRSKESRRDRSKESRRDRSKESRRDRSKESRRDRSKESRRDRSKESRRDRSRERRRDRSRERRRDVSRDKRRDSPREARRERKYERQSRDNNSDGKERRERKYERRSKENSRDSKDRQDEKSRRDRSSDKRRSRIDRRRESRSPLRDSSRKESRREERSSRGNERSKERSSQRDEKSRERRSRREEASRIEEPTLEETSQTQEAKLEEIRPKETKPEELKPEELKPEELKPEELKPEELKPEELKPKETKLEETSQIEETKSEETGWREKNKSI
ncbi:unnamed protein product [Rhizopus stolonifer]